MHSLTSSLRKSTLTADFTKLVISQGGTQIVGALAGLAIVRFLSPEEYSRYILAITTIGLAAVGAQFGLNTILIRNTAQAPAQANRLLADVGVLRLIFSTAAIGIVVAVSTLWQGFGEPLLLLVFGLSLLPTSIVHAFYASWIGLGRTGHAAVLNSVRGMLIPLAVTLAAYLTGHVVTTLAAATLVLTVLAVLLLNLNRAQLVRPQMRRWPPLAKAGAPLALAGLAGFAFRAFDLYIVGWLVDPELVATYAVPIRVLMIVMVPPTVWGVAALPRFAALIDDTEAMRRMLVDWLPRMALAGFAGAFAITLLARWVTNLVLGPTYADSAPLLTILIWMTFFVYVSAPFVALLTALDWQMMIAWAVVVAGLFAVALDWFYAPRFGVVGVALVRVGAMALLFGFYVFLTQRALAHRSAEMQS